MKPMKKVAARGLAGQQGEASTRFAPRVAGGALTNAANTDAWFLQGLTILSSMSTAPLHLLRRLKIPTRQRDLAHQ